MNQQHNHIKSLLLLISIKKTNWYNLFSFWGYENIAKELELEEEDFLYNKNKFIEQYKEYKNTSYKQLLNEFTQELGEEFCKEKRLDFLNDKLENLNKEINYAYERNDIMKKNRVPFWLRSSLMHHYYNITLLESNKNKIERLIKILTSDIKTNKFTPEEILLAETTDPSLFLDFNNAGFCICPFHEERTPSMKYYSDTHKLHCYGCGWHGNMIDFIMKLNKVSFIEAVKTLLK